MNTRCSAVVLGVAAVALLAHFSTALGAGKITGLTLNLPAIKTCAVETITVKGTGECGGLTVFLGDSNKIIFLPSKVNKGKLPAEFHHTYSKMGTYKVSAEAYTGPGSTCTGKASVTLQVAAGPWITSMFLFSQATPGGWILLSGENFGDMPGQVWIHLTDWQGHSQDHQLLDTQKYWGDTFVAGSIPSISGVLDQQATFTVVAQCGATSNARSANFTAARDFVDLAYVSNPPPGHWYGWLQCSMSSGVTDSDECEDTGNANFPLECGGPGPWGLAPGTLGNLAGYHASGWGFQGDPGDDLYWLNTPLQNGWVLDSTSADVSRWVNNGGQVSVNPGETSAPGTPSPMLDVNWYINNCGAIFYSSHMIITGPVGVPF